MTKANEKQAAEQRRGRPGRRSASERLEAVRALLSGKASVEQLSQKYAVTQETIESWRAQGLEGLEASLRAGGASASTSREKELEREREQLKAALTRAVMEKELLQEALDLERRFLRFLGHQDGDVIELQTLGVPNKYAPTNHFTHAKTVEKAIDALKYADEREPTGSYVLFNAVDPAVATRAASGSWHQAKRGESTTDRDVRARRAVYIDVTARDLRDRGPAHRRDDDSQGPRREGQARQAQVSNRREGLRSRDGQPQHPESFVSRRLELHHPPSGQIGRVGRVNSRRRLTLLRGTSVENLEREPRCDPRGS